MGEFPDIFAIIFRNLTDISLLNCYIHLRYVVSVVDICKVSFGSYTVLLCSNGHWSIFLKIGLNQKCFDCMCSIFLDAQ